MVLNIFSGKLKRNAAAGTYLLRTQFAYIGALVDGYRYILTKYKFTHENICF